MLDYEKGREIASDIGDSFDRNTVPLALLGAGLGWLIVANFADGKKSRRKVPGSSGSATDRNKGPSRVSSAAKSASGRAKAAANDAYDRTMSTAEDVYDRTRNTAEDAWSSVRSTVKDRGREWGDMASDRAQRVYGRASRSFSDMVDEQPLLLGGAGLIIGAVIGAALPRSHVEDDLVGETRDDLVRSAKEYGREQFDRAQKIVEQTVETVKEEAKEQGFTADSVKKAAEHAMDEVKERAAAVGNAAAEAAKDANGSSDKPATGPAAGKAQPDTGADEKHGKGAG